MKQSVLPSDVHEILQNNFNLSSEEIVKLHQFHDLLVKWNSSYNLVSTNEINNLWHRHFIDCLEVVVYLKTSSKIDKIFDLGSGGGFPAILLSILGYKLVLFEKSQKKCQFLLKCKFDLSLDFEIKNIKLDHKNTYKSKVVISRAMASLSDLISLSRNMLSTNGYCIFFKGEKLHDELIKAQKLNNFSYTIYNRESGSGCFIKIYDIKN